MNKFFHVTDCTEDFKFEVKTIIVGQNVTLLCPHQTSALYRETLYWIRLVSGNWPEFLGATFNFVDDDVSKISHIQTKQEQGKFLLYINEAKRNDNGLYYCIKIRQLDFIFINGNFLKVQGNIINKVLINHIMSYFLFFLVVRLKHVLFVFQD
uniref:PPUP9126 n=1 Tax=Poeciliopsis prolifica TaxID=188132 RepID=A0A0S7EJE7_9TELE